MAPESPARACLDRLIRDITGSAPFKSLNSTIHGREHAYRVLMFTGLLVQMIETKHPGLDRSIVAAAALLHDVGRVSDGADPEHGRRSADLARKWARRRPEINARLLSRVIIFHCPPPGYVVPEPPPIEARILADADKLDRFRLGGLEAPLRIEALRLKESLALVNLAAEINGHPFRLRGV